jgi:putative membrane protein
MIFCKEDKKAIEAAVKAAEKSTSGEIVPVVVKASGDYAEVSQWLALLGLLVGTGAALYLHHARPFIDLYLLFGLQVITGIIFWQLGQIPFLIRVLTSQRRMGEEVHEAALAAFTRNGLHHTKGETGVLIYISLLEHRVEILADRGIHSKAGEDYWKAEVNKISAGIRAGEAANSLVAVISEIGQKLAENFPVAPGDRNELGDDLRSR